MSQLPEHLGGHKNKTHLDEGALDFAVKLLNVKTMLDIGCGPGGMVGLSRSKGIESYGIDGDYSIERPGIDPQWITIHDYEKGPSNINKDFDLIWSVEFVEHVYEDYQENYMKDFQKGKIVIMTFAPPDTPGHHHVNCNTKEYWINVFDKYGFTFDQGLTEKVRLASTMGRWKRNKSTGEKFFWKDFVKQNGLCFIKR